jgi:nucleoid DNA-binding protein
MTESLAQEENLEKQEVQEVQEEYGRDFLIHEIALRAGFTVGDARVMFNAFEGIIKDIVAEKSTVLIGGLFSIKIHKILPHEGWDLNSKQKKMRDVGYRMTIKPSITLKRLLKFGKNEIENPLKEEEK